MTWSEKRKAVVEAIHDKRLDDAERLFDELRAMTRELTDPRYEADERFAEGLLRDAQRRFDDAEAAFRKALELDRRSKGERHPAVGETLHSLAIVRANLGDHRDAVALYREALEIFRETRAAHLPSVHASIGREMLALGDGEGALEAFEASEKAARGDEKTPRHVLARAMVGAGEALMRMKRWVPAFAKLAACTQLSTGTMWPKLAREMGAAWMGVAVVSRRGFRDAQPQAAFAFWFAQVVGSDVVKQKASAQLETMPERTLAAGDPGQLRVVWRDAKGNVHVASCAHGLRHVKSDASVAIGDTVEIAQGTLRRSSPTPASLH